MATRNSKGKSDFYDDGERRIKNPYGFCMLCGEPNRRPRHFEFVWVCDDCIAARLEDTVSLNLEYRKLKEPPVTDITKT